MCLATRTRTIEVSYSDNRATFMGRLAGTGGVGRWMVSRSDQRKYATELLFAGGAHHLWANFGSEGVRNGQRVQLRVTYVSDGERVVQLMMEPVRSPRAARREDFRWLEARRAAAARAPAGDHDQREGARQTWFRRICDGQVRFRHVAPGRGDDRAPAANEVIGNLEGYRDFWRSIIMAERTGTRPVLGRYAEQGRQRALRLYRQLRRAPPEIQIRVLRDPSGRDMLRNMDGVIEQAQAEYTRPVGR